MAEYWDRERGRRYRGEGYYGGYYGYPERERERDREREYERRGGDRGFFDRAGDEVRSWFGDEDAQRRRVRDERDTRAEDRGWGREQRGYQRSDERIREDVCERMSDCGELDATDIEVRVSNAEVTLQGMVRDRQDKRLAEDLVDEVSGVREVHNQIRVSQPGSDAGQGQQQQQRYRIA